MMVNKRPVLIYQTRLAPIRVIVTISDIHLRDALYSDTDNNGLALWVQNQMIARYGDVKPLAADPHQRYLPRPLANSTTPARSPAEFIPLAERTGLIIPLTRSLMAQVNAQMRPLFSKLPDGFHIGLNISVSHINAPTFIDDCLHYQRGFEGKAVKLMLEITEQEPLLLNGAVVDKLNTLHSRGFSIALDDFGTGYSGLSCLHELIFDYIKIDQSFVGRVTGEAPASKLLDCVIEMARTLSLRIIAEGVETEAQRDYLNRQNIHLLQGYYFWKPMPYVALVMLLLSKPKARIVEE